MRKALQNAPAALLEALKGLTLTLTPNPNPNPDPNPNTLTPTPPPYPLKALKAAAHWLLRLVRALRSSEMLRAPPQGFGPMADTAAAQLCAAVAPGLELLEDMLRQITPIVEHAEMAEGHGHVLKDVLVPLTRTRTRTLTLTPTPTLSPTLTQVPLELDLLLGALHAKERRGEAAGFELLALQLVREAETSTLTLALTLALTLTLTPSPSPSPSPHQARSCSFGRSSQ